MSTIATSGRSASTSATQASASPADRRPRTPRRRGAARALAQDTASSAITTRMALTRTGSSRPRSCPPPGGARDGTCRRGGDPVRRGRGARRPGPRRPAVVLDLDSQRAVAVRGRGSTPSSPAACLATFASASEATKYAVAVSTARPAVEPGSTTTGTGERSASARTPDARPASVRIAGWIPRASSRSPRTTAAPRPRRVERVRGSVLADARGRPAQRETPARRGAAGRRRAGRARSAAARRRPPRRSAPARPDLRELTVHLVTLALVRMASVVTRRPTQREPGPRRAPDRGRRARRARRGRDRRHGAVPSPPAARRGRPPRRGSCHLGVPAEHPSDGSPSACRSAVPSGDDVGLAPIPAIAAATADRVAPVAEDADEHADGHQEPGQVRQPGQEHVENSGVGGTMPSSVSGDGTHRSPRPR